MVEMGETDQEIIRTLEFLAHTKDGRYSKIELTSIRYARLRSQRSELLLFRQLTSTG